MGDTTTVYLQLDQKEILTILVYQTQISKKKSVSKVMEKERSNYNPLYNYMKLDQ